MLSILRCSYYCYISLYSVFYPTTRAKYFWFVVIICHYAFNVTFLSFIKSDSTFCNLLCSLEIIDRNLSVNTSSFHLDVKFTSVILFSVVYRVTVIYLYCAVSDNCILSFWNRLLFVTILGMDDFVLITNTFVYYAVQCRLEKIISSLEFTNCNIVFLHRTYKALLDIAYRHKAVFDLPFLIALSANVPEAMATIYFSVIELLRKKTKKGALELVADYATVTAALTLTFTPAIIAGMLTSKAYQLRVSLYNKLIIQTDESRICEIERFIRYVEIRGCTFRVWKVIPLDANLTLMVLSFCVTYLIVIIQFTNIHQL